jgi:putative DNA primase/helicase
VITGTDLGIWRRVRELPVLVTIPEAQQDKRLPDRLQDELPGILRWAVDGCLAYQREGLGLPLAVKQATNEYREESDALAQFLAQECATGDELLETARELYAGYQRWCSRAGEEWISQKAFGSSLRERGFTSQRLARGYVWRGVSLRGAAE